MGSGCFRHKTCIHSNLVRLPLAGGRAGERRFIFLREEEGLEPVQTLVPIAANCSNKPRVTNAAAGTFLQEGRFAVVRCAIHQGHQCGQNRPLQLRLSLTQHLLACAVSRLLQCTIAAIEIRSRVPNPNNSFCASGSNKLAAHQVGLIILLICHSGYGSYARYFLIEATVAHLMDEYRLILIQLAFSPESRCHAVCDHLSV